MSLNAAETMEYKAGLSANQVREFSRSGEIVKLSSNENPFGPSPKAVTAAILQVAEGHVYPEHNDGKFREALARYYGRGLDKDNFITGNGGLEILGVTEDALLLPGQRAIICPPCFGAYASSLKNKGVIVDVVRLSETDYSVNVDAVLAAVTPETRLVYLCNPNNPTGTWFGEDVLTTVLDNLPPEVTLVYDEVYFHFAQEGVLPDSIRHVLDGRNMVAIHSFSKGYGLAGFRVGYGIAPAAVAARLQKRKRAFHLNGVSGAAAIAALTDSEHLEKTVNNNTVERAKVTDQLRALGLDATTSQTNFVMFRCPEGFDADAMTAALLREGVMVRPAFNLSHHVRVTIGTPKDNEQLIGALKRILES